MTEKEKPNRLKALKAATGLPDVAVLLGFKAKALAYLLYRLPAADKYKKFEIPKKRGGVRQISAPMERIKLLQRRLADLLQDCVLEINETHNFADSLAHGFKRKRSIVTNAKIHRGRRYVFNVDIKDFFPSINFGRVRAYFMIDRNFSLDEKVATVIAQIACYEDALPQGSPCSPVISNLIGHILDIHLAKLAFAEGCKYSRYADDLSFSSNDQEFPAEIARRTHENPHTWEPSNKLLRVIKKSGFELNTSKTRMQYRNSRQEVTGLIVNRKINVRREYRHLTRALVFRLINTGSFEFRRKEKDESGVDRMVAVPGTTDQLHGMLGFVDMLDEYNRKRERERAEERGEKVPESKDHSDLSTKELVFRKFLLFVHLYAATEPLIICEGPTDNIYITNAIRALATEFPALARVDAGGKVNLALKLFNYTRRNTGRILGIESGGTSNLRRLIRAYVKERQKFRAPGESHPVIVVIDNDKEAVAVFTLIEEITGEKRDRTQLFHHIAGNLYLVATPGKPGASVIEDLFDEATLGIVLGGKTFARGSGYDTAVSFGKKEFAVEVVERRPVPIEFGGFRPLLERIALTIGAHKKKAEKS